MTDRFVRVSVDRLDVALEQYKDRRAEIAARQKAQGA